jgi:ABC-type Mn2+/Zn2+ transport system ATPase subunit
MKKLSLNLQYCYGIKKLETEFDFSRKKTFAIYAPNGVMKTSFAKTFKDLSNNQNSKDLVFPDRETIRSIKDENNNDLLSEEVFVIEPYNEQFNSDKLSTLVVKKELKYKYDTIHQTIDKAKDDFFKKLKQLSGLTARTVNIQEEIEKTFKENFFGILEKLETKIDSNSNAEFSNIIYNEIFNDKILAFLKTKNFKKQIKAYIEKYNEIIQNSTYLKKDFNHYHATTVQKNLKDNGFFGAKHSVNLFDGSSKQEISDSTKFEELIKQEKEKVLNNEDLQKEFEEIDKKLSNADLRKFRDYLFDNKDVLIKLENIDDFQKELWISYFIDQKELFKTLLSEYTKGKVEIAKIIEEAKKEKTDWEKAVKDFNYRFKGLPFKLKIENKDDVILKTTTPSIKFIFHDSGEEKNIERKDLLEVLSQGERRALYILNIIFEVEARKKSNQKTLFIIDDIADSFDYKNKYAIIEYLKDISEKDNFYQIILTHNFDFYRSIEGRFIGRSNCKMIIKTTEKISLENAECLKPFQYFKDNLHTNNKILIASIPFVRNLAEYSGYNDEFTKLTSLLHIKSNKNNLTVQDLQEIFKKILKDKSSLQLNDTNKKIIDLIFELADEILQNTDEVIALENKIVLSIAIRLGSFFRSGIFSSKNELNL